MCASQFKEIFVIQCIPLLTPAQSLVTPHYLESDNKQPIIAVHIFWCCEENISGDFPRMIVD